MADEQAAGRKSLADKLERLFRAVHPPGRGEYSFEEVARTIQQRGGPTISATYIWQLRKGLRDNPTKKHLEALADFFQVSPAYFFDDEVAERIQAELELLAALRNPAAREIALRAHELSPESAALLADMAERIRRIERPGHRQPGDEGGQDGGRQDE